MKRKLLAIVLVLILAITAIAQDLVVSPLSNLDRVGVVGARSYKNAETAGYYCITVHFDKDTLDPSEQIFIVSKYDYERKYFTGTLVVAVYDEDGKLLGLRLKTDQD